MEAYLQFFWFLAIVGFMTLIGRDMIKYPPGERSRIKAEERKLRHTRSHYNTRNPR